MWKTHVAREATSLVSLLLVVAQGIATNGGIGRCERSSWHCYVRNEKLLGTSATLLGTSALPVVTRSY